MEIANCYEKLNLINLRIFKYYVLLKVNQLKHKS